MKTRRKDRLHRGAVGRRIILVVFSEIYLGNVLTPLLELQVGGAGARTLNPVAALACH